jgi:hypothetical protein
MQLPVDYDSCGTRKRDKDQLCRELRAQHEKGSMMATTPEPTEDEQNAASLPLLILHPEDINGTAREIAKRLYNDYQDKYGLPEMKIT